MELILDYLSGFTVFIFALAVSTSLILYLSLPPPTGMGESTAYPSVVVREGVVSSDKPLRVWIVYYRDGWDIIEENTPAELPEADFVAVFTGLNVVYYEGIAGTVSGYVTRHGFIGHEPRPPYIRLQDGKVREVKNC